MLIIKDNAEVVQGGSETLKHKVSCSCMEIDFLITRCANTFLPAGLESVWVKNEFVCFGACDPSCVAANHTYLLLKHTHKYEASSDYHSSTQTNTNTHRSVRLCTLVIEYFSFWQGTGRLCLCLHLFHSGLSLYNNCVCKRWRETGEVGIIHSFGALICTALWPAAFSDDMNKISACSATSLSKTEDQEINLPHTSPPPRAQRSHARSVERGEVFSVWSRFNKKEKKKLILNPSGCMCMQVWVCLIELHVNPIISQVCVCARTRERETHSATRRASKVPWQQLLHEQRSN